MKNPVAIRFFNKCGAFVQGMSISHPDTAGTIGEVDTNSSYILP